MNQKMTFEISWKFFLAIGLLVLTSASAEAPSTLTCDISQQPHGFSYGLSQPPSSSKCETSWELKNKTVIARNSDFDRQWVRNLTNQILTLDHCHSYLHYTRDCPEIWEEVQCKIDCSHILHFKDNLTTTVNSTFCITKSWCLTPTLFGLGVTVIVGIFIVACVIMAVQRSSICKCIKRASATSRVLYTPANGKNNKDQDEMERVTVKT